jgi:hypothetical protein
VRHWKIEFTVTTHSHVQSSDFIFRFVRPITHWALKHQVLHSSAHISWLYSVCWEQRSRISMSQSALGYLVNLRQRARWKRNQPAGQRHVYVRGPVTIHEPPFWQGVGEHGMNNVSHRVPVYNALHWHLHGYITFIFTKISKSFEQTQKYAQKVLQRRSDFRETINRLPSYPY